MPWLFIAPITLLHLIVVVGPSISGMYYALTDWSGIGKADFIGLENFRELFFEDSNFRLALRHNVMWLAFFLTVPLVYCVESTDNPAVDMWGVGVALPPGNGSGEGGELIGRYRQSALLNEFEADFRQDLLGGVIALRGQGGSSDEPNGMLTFIPYYAWGNRDSRSSLRTWIDGRN